MVYVFLKPMFWKKKMKANKEHILVVSSASKRSELRLASVNIHFFCRKRTEDGKVAPPLVNRQQGSARSALPRSTFTSLSFCRKLKRTEDGKVAPLLWSIDSI